MAIDDADSGDAEPSGAPGVEVAPERDAPATGGAAVGDYSWDDYKREFFYDEDGNPPEGETFDEDEVLPYASDTRTVLGDASAVADLVAGIREYNTVRVNPDIDEDAFFSDGEGAPTVVSRYDLEKAVPHEKKSHFREVDRYWVNKPYAFVIIFHSEKENEKKYYLVEPYLTPIERDLKEFLSGKLKTAIKYSSDDVVVEGSDDARAGVIERETRNLLDRYDLYEGDGSPVTRGGTDSVADDGGLMDQLRDGLGQPANDGATGNGGLMAQLREGLGRPANDGGTGNGGLMAQLKEGLGMAEETDDAALPATLAGLSVRPEPALLEEDSETLSEYQIEKLLYLLKRNFIGFERIDGIKHDINVEDISCDGYNSPAFVYHSDYEQIITNVYHGEAELDDFVVKMAQRSGKGISKRQPQVDATLPDGSRAQLTLGREVSDHGTNYTIRQFKDVPFTPIDLINWNTFSLDEMAFLWLCIENNKSLIFAGGTASGKTTSLNAVSLFIPSKAKIVSIEDTREVELPQRNWIASVTRPSFSDDDKGDVDEFDLLEAALRQRPEYIVMGEIRGEEGRTLFQVMSTGHTTLTTFHADSVGEVIKRFTTEPINVSKTMFTALDLVSVQTSTRVKGRKVRRNKSLTEINHYDPENDEINVQDVYQWQAESDEYLKMGQSNTVEEIMFDRGWSHEELDRQIETRKIVLAYLINHGLNTYTQVAASMQAFMNDEETILTLIANDRLERSLEDLREMESVQIDIDPEKEAMVPRPDANEGMLEHTDELLEAAEPLLEEYRGEHSEGVASALLDSLDADTGFDFDSIAGALGTDGGEPMGEGS